MESHISVLDRLWEKRDAASEEANVIVRRFDEREKRGGGTVTEAEEARCKALFAEIDEFDQRIKEETANRSKQDRITEARAGVLGGVGVSSHDGVRVSVTGEAMVYGPDSPNSWYADMITLDRRSVMDPGYRAANERMLQWSDQVEHEVADDSKFGKVAERQLREVYRSEQETKTERALAEIRSRGRVSRDVKDGTESRAITTGGGTTASAAGGGAASFVTPVFAAPYIPYREYGRAFADQCSKPVMPDYGMAIYKPVVTGPAGVAQFTEAGTVTEVDPAAGYVVANLVIFAGQVTLSQVVIDRTSPDFRFDIMCEDQLRRDYDPKFDKYVLTQVLAGATSQSYTGAFAPSVASAAGGFYGQVSKAKAGMRKLTGTVLNPTSLFLDPARYEYLAAWADAQGRALVVPDYAGPFNALGGSGDGDAGIEGYTGTRFNGLPVFTDANIPTTGGTANLDQALVGDLAEVEVYEGNPINRVLPQTLGSNLLTLLQRYSYATVLVNYGAAVTAINGTAMSAPVYS